MAIAIGFDVGTQGTKGVAVRLETSEIIARGRAHYDLMPGLPAGHAEQHPDTWTEALRHVAAELVAHEGLDPSEVVALGVSGQQHGAVLLDADDTPLRPAKLWCDTSAVAEAEELSSVFGRAIPAGFTAPKLLWSKRHEPALWDRVRRVLLPHDYINLRLTGAATMEAGDASGTGLLDIEKRDWARADVDALDARLIEYLPSVSAAGQPAGRLSAAGAAWLGLPEGIVVGAGGGDNMMSAIGAGATRPGVVVTSLGTSGTVFARSDAPVLDPEGHIAAFCDSAGAWLPLLCVMNCTGVLEELARSFAMDHASLSAAARALPAGTDGLRWIPFLQGERVPDLPAATGTLLGMRSGWMEPGRLYRAALEGISLNLGAGVERLRRLGLPVDEVRLVGGAARNATWQRILAAVFGVPLVVLEETETAALGAALQAAWIAEREEGEGRELTAIVEPFVRIAGEPVEPPETEIDLYRELAERFADDLERQYDVH